MEDKKRIIGRLKEISRRVRINILRMLERAGSGHSGGSLSCVEILVALYFQTMKPEDIFVLSKGHAAPALYAVLAEKGLILEEELKTLRKLDSRLQGHTSLIHLPEVQFSAGVLGQGLSFASGLAVSAKLRKSKRHHYVLLSDGEMQCGKTWAAAQMAAHYRLNNLCAIIDNNGYQIDGRIEDIRKVDFVSGLRSFGWITFGADGHNLTDLIDALEHALLVSQASERPVAVIAQTIKGRGISFMENNNKYHGVAPTRKELVEALSELGGELW